VAPTSTEETLVRKLVIAAALIASAAPAATAQQRAWTPSIGIQGGYTRVEPTGGGDNDHVDFFDVPGQSYVGGLLTYGGLFVILPVGNKLALEPSLTLSYLATASGTSNATALVTRLGLRADYAFSNHIYAAAGAVLAYIDQNPGLTSAQFGVHAAGGYRFRLNRVFNARAEFGITPLAESDAQGPNAAYTLLFGLSSASSGGGPAPRSAAAANRRTTRLGFQGGFSSMAQPEGDFSAAFTTFPLLGGSVTGIGTTVASPPTMFLLFPVGARTAIEAGVDLHRVQQASSGTTAASANLAGRVLLTVSGNWYAAGGLNINYVKRTGIDAGVITGANVGWGYDFPAGGNWRGRVELNLQAMKENEDLNTGAQNVVSLLLGLSVPLK
jgi:hypothetical protein